MQRLLVPILLVLAVLAVYAQTGGFDFVNFDDPEYVYRNPRVLGGLTGENVAWAFTSREAQNWHPLVWLSLMLDAELSGTDPGGYHRTNVFLHLVNVLLLFFLLRRLTGARWRSAAVAALFALHPLHVESVAWVTERKDVLSQCLGLLSAFAYVRWAERGRRRDYLLCALLFALGLMAKQMLVTLPLVFLLLDRWPLGRLALGRAPEAGEQPLGKLVVEKLPLLALGAIAGLLTVGAQTRTVAIPLADRAANAVVAVARYLGKLVWPADLSAMYPHPALPGGEPLAAWQVAGAALLVLAISAVVWALRRRRYLVVGWMWFLVTLAPVSGLLQVGEQAMADRYAYLPFLGLYLMLAWGLGDLAGADGGQAAAASRQAAGARRAAIAGVFVLALLGLGAAAHLRAGDWRDSLTLGESALRTPPVAPKMLYNLGLALSREGRHAEALPRYREALAAQPLHAKAHNNLGLSLHRLDEPEAAERHFRLALRLQPDLQLAHENLSALLFETGDLEGAIQHRRRAVALEPADPVGRNNLGVLLGQAGRLEEAAAEFRAALALDPGYADARRNLARVDALLGELRER